MSSVAILVIAITGCTATYTIQNLGGNPLPALARVLEKEGEYAVTLVGKDHLELRNTWVGSSIMGLGWYAFRSNLDYRNGKLYGEHYLRANGLWSLWLPFYLDSGEGFVGAMVRPWIREEKNYIVRRSGGMLVKESHGELKSIDERAGKKVVRPSTQKTTPTVKKAPEKKVSEKQPPAKKSVRKVLPVEK